MITTSPLSQHHHYHNRHYHNITTFTKTPWSQPPLSQHHHYHNITTITTTAITININTVSPLSQYHHHRKPLSQPPLSRSLARKLRCHICHWQILRDVSHEMRFWKLADARNVVFCRTKRALDDGWGRSVARRFRSGPERSRLCSDHGRIGPALELTVQASFCPTWTFKIWRMSRTKASFSHLQLSDFEGSLARKLRFHIFHFHFLEGSPARKLRFHIFHFHFFREVSHDSFVGAEIRFWSCNFSRCCA